MVFRELWVTWVTLGGFLVEVFCGYSWDFWDSGDGCDGVV